MPNFLRDAVVRDLAVTEAALQQLNTALLRSTAAAVCTSRWS